MKMMNFFSKIKGLKVKDLPVRLKPMLSIGYTNNAIKKGMGNYHRKYIITSPPAFLFHIFYGGMAFSYLITLPEERRHLEHQKLAKEHDGH